MTRYRLIYLAPILTALGLNVGPAGEWGLVHAQEQSKVETLRPEVAKLLQEAQELLKAQMHKEAMAKIAEADSASNKTAFESFYIDRIRGAVAISSGDNELAVKSIEAVFATGRLSATDQLKLVEALADSYYRAKNYAKAASWAARYFKEGGSGAQMRTLLIQSYYSGNDFANAAKELQSAIQAAEMVGQSPPENLLQMLASSYLKQNDNAGYVAVLEKLVTYYPKKDYWADLTQRTLQKPGYAERLSLDTYRLLLAIGNMNTSSNYVDMAQLTLKVGLPMEGKRVLDQGFGSGLLGVGSDAGRHKQLRDFVAKQVAQDQKTLDEDAARAATQKEGTGFVNYGFTYVINGQFDKGLAMMEQGISKGGLKRPDDDRLHLGIAYLMAGQKAKAIEVFKTVQGTDGTAELARLWMLHAPRYAS